jgi:DNA-binding IclR family transcriptional regulator
MSSFIGEPQLMSQSGDTERGFYSAPALEKGLDVLELLAEIGEPLSMRTIAQRLDRSKSEIFRMVHVLQQRGYLEREVGSDRLALSRRLFDLGMRSPGGRQLTSVVLPLMERFSEETGQAAHLVVLSRSQTVVVATTLGHTDASVSIRLGYGRPALQANSGLLILAFQPEERRRSLMRDAGAEAIELLSAPAIADEMARIRTLGYEIAPSRDILAVTDIICPVLGVGGRAEAAVTVPCLQRRDVTPDHLRILASLQACCSEASTQMGHHTPA